MRKLQITTTLGVIVFLSYFLWNSWADLQQLIDVDPLMLVVLFLLYISFFYLAGVFLKVIVIPFGIQLRTREYVSLSVVSTFLNVITPFRGGMGIRALYLKKKYGLPFKSFFVTMMGTYIVVFFVSLTSILIFLLYAASTVQTMELLLTILLIAVADLSIIIIVLFPFRVPWKGALVAKYNQLVEGWIQLVRTRKTLGQLLILQLISVVLGSLTMYAEFRALGIDSDFLSCLFLTNISAMSLLISLTPGSLGIREALLAVGGSLLGMESAGVVAVSLLDRILGFVYSGIFYPFAHKHVAKFK